jgi:signal transduction histidine kinase
MADVSAGQPMATRFVELLKDFEPRRPICLFRGARTPGEFVIAASHPVEAPFFPACWVLTDAGPVTECLRTGQAVCWRAEEAPGPSGLVGCRPWTVLAHPIASEGQEYGALLVADFDRDFTSGERQFYEVVAGRLTALTGRIRLQRSLQAEAALREAILEQMDVGVVLTDLAHRTTKWNRAIAPYFRAPEQVVAATVEDPPGPEDFGRYPIRCDGLDLREAVRQVIATGETLTNEMTVFCDPPHTFRVTTGPARGVHGQVEGVVQTFTDVTSYRQLERRKSELIAMISHELRTPLTSIRGYGTLLERYGEGDESHQRLLRGLRRETEALTELIERVVAVSHLDVERKFVSQPISLQEVLAAAVAGLQPFAGSRGVTIEIQGSDVKSEGDSDSLELVFTNLLHNAVKFSPRGGKVLVRLTVEGTQAKIRIADDGPGIPLEHQEAIFERFYRVQAPEAVSLPGTGMGLYIVRRLVRRHRGEVTVESQPGYGTTFTVSLPEGVTDCGESEDPGGR